MLSVERIDPRTSCRCERPLLKYVDGKPSDHCSHCFRKIARECLATDETIAWFFKRLEEGIFPIHTSPEKRQVFWALQDFCMAREADGREIFEDKYLWRDNLQEAAEEIADAINYLFFDVLQAYRIEGEVNDIDMVLQTVNYGAKFFEGLADIKAKRKGSPEMWSVREDDEAA